MLVIAQAYIAFACLHAAPPVVSLRSLRLNYGWMYLGSQPTGAMARHCKRNSHMGTGLNCTLSRGSRKIPLSAGLALQTQGWTCPGSSERSKHFPWTFIRVIVPCKTPLHSQAREGGKRSQSTVGLGAQPVQHSAQQSHSTGGARLRA